MLSGKKGLTKINDNIKRTLNCQLLNVIKIKTLLYMFCKYNNVKI